MKNSDFVDENQDQFGIKIRKTKITALATSLLQRLYHQGNTEETEMVVEVSRDPEENQPKTLSDELASFMEERHQTTKVQDKIENSIVKKEISPFEATKKDQKIYKNCSRRASYNQANVCGARKGVLAMGLFAAKFRSQLGDETFNALIVMRQKFNKNK